MEKLEIQGESPAESELNSLMHRAKSAVALLQRPDCEAKRPFYFEFAGTPKAGKSSVIGIIGHFFRRAGFSVVTPAEGASLRTPDAMREDWLAFNTWSVCYALRQILEISHERVPPDLVILDRGLFDATAWLHFLESSRQRLSADDRSAIASFLELDFWRIREQAVFVFTTDSATALVRESDSMLTRDHGSVMNPDTLHSLNNAYRETGDRCAHKYRLFHVDTSFVNGHRPRFDRMALIVAERMLKLMHSSLDQNLLITSPVADMRRLEMRPERVEPVIQNILNEGHPRFKRRTEAESDPSVMQVVPYALVAGGDGRYLVAKRRSDHPRRELSSKFTVLLGGHAEEKDWDSTNPGSVFERCLRRELDEELIGANIKAITQVGIINDDRTPAGQKHLAILFEVVVGGPPKIRRQAADQEFGREPLAWRSAEEIKELVRELDPWSQVVAQEKFGAVIPELPEEPTLFTRGRAPDAD